MGERKGVNKWYPPDYDPRKGGLNKFQGTHALRERARKLHLGILIIRFEMPYNIWCEGCGNHVGMGVRYNAEKKKVGMYYTTPIYQFRMKCHLCDNHFEIKTDPANLDYTIVSGARRQERRWDATQNEQVVPEDKAVGRKLYDDAMFKLEHGSEDTAKGKGAEPRIKKLTTIQDRVKDDYLANRILRDKMRQTRKVAKLNKEKDDALLRKSSLNIALVPENPDDVKVASLLSLKPSETSEQRLINKRMDIIEESIFPSSLSSSATKAKASTPRAVSKRNLTNIVNRHRLEVKQSKAEPMTKGIGVIVKKSRSSTPSTPSSAASPPSADGEEMVIARGDPNSNLMSSLCDYGSTSSESD